MNSFLLDASGLAKRYLAERGSTLVNHLFAQVSRLRLFCLMLGAAETAAALARRRNGGLLSAGAYGLAIAQLKSEILDAADFTKLTADNPLIRSAIPLLEKHSINSSDGVALQAALNLATLLRSQGRNIVLVASDQRLIKAAQAEALTAFDPETQSQADLDALIGP